MRNLQEHLPVGRDPTPGKPPSAPVLDRPVAPDRIPAGLGRPKGVDGAESWHVVLWNDDHNTMDHVVTALIKVLDGVDLQGAFQLMRIAHARGSAFVAKAPLERAELYREGLEGFGLTATLERAGKQV
ncbi:MAG: ATP-dependent Clp protease adaptor ClpS [Cyanobacteria bacterium REEB65]|nr:ATP-dependent Clp protease adaptor ClpS [Cyanobacteria bacterium REEB65]